MFKVGETLVSKRDYSWMKESEKRWYFYPKFYLTKGKPYTITYVSGHYIYLKNGCGIEEKFAIEENTFYERKPEELTNYWGDWFYTKEELLYLLSIERDKKLNELLQ